LEDLFSGTVPKQSQKLKTAKRSSKSKTIKSLSSPDRVDKKKSKKAVSSKKLLGGGDPLTDRRNESQNTSNHSAPFEVNESDYETDTDDDLEFGSDNKEASPKKMMRGRARSERTETSKQDLVERALSMGRSSMKRSLSRKRMMDALSISGHRKGREEGCDKNKRLLDTLSISGHKKGRDEEIADKGDGSSMRKSKSATSLASCNKGRGSGTSTRRARRATTKKDFLDGSAPSDSTPKRCSSLKAPPARQRAGGLDNSNHSTRSVPKPKRSASVGRKKKIVDLEDDSSHSEETSSSVTRRKKDMDRSTRSVGSRRSSGMKKKRNSSKTRLSEDSGFLASGSTRQSGRRVPTKKTPNNAEDEMVQPISGKSFSSSSEDGIRRGSKISKSMSGQSSVRTPRSPKRKSKSPFRSSGGRKLRSEEFSAAADRRMSNMSLSSSEHGRPKRSPRVAKEGGDKEKVLRRMKRRNSSTA